MCRTLATFVLAGMVVAAAVRAQAPLHVSFGIYSFKRPVDVYKQFRPATDALGEKLSESLGMPATIDIIVTKTYEECLEDFVAGKIDIVRFGPASYVLAKQSEPRIQILAAEREDARGAGLIVVRDDSPFRKLSDLVGKRFAFGDEQSTIGRFLSQAELAKAGVTAKDLAAHSFLDRHDLVFNVVELGDYEAGALHVATFKDLNAKAKDKLRVLHAFDNVAKPWLARADLEPHLVDGLRKALLAIDDAKALKALKVPGFEVASDSDYDLVREGMKLSEQFKPSPKAEPTPQPDPSPAPGKGR